MPFEKFFHQMGTAHSGSQFIIFFLTRSRQTECFYFVISILSRPYDIVVSWYDKGLASPWLNQFLQPLFSFFKLFSYTRLS